MPVSTTVLDHIAIGTRSAADGLALFSGVLGGEWVYGAEVAFGWGQVRFGSGPKVEILTPTPNPGSAFLERFLASRGPGPHHFNFAVTDIEAILQRVRAAGIEPVGERLDEANWKEAFLHPRDAYGIVVQVAQAGGEPPQRNAPADLPPPGPPCELALIEHYVNDLDGATRLFGEVLAGEVARAADGEQPAAELTWANGARLRLIQAPPPEAGAEQSPTGGVPGALRFARDGRPFSPAERARAAELSARLGVSLDLRG